SAALKVTWTLMAMSEPPRAGVAGAGHPPARVRQPFGSGPAVGGQGARVEGQLGRGRRPHPVDQPRRRDAAVDRDLDPEAVEQGGEPPAGAGRVWAGEIV